MRYNPINEKLTNWHDWFAWYPVQVKNYETMQWQWVWLETLKRKGTYVYLNKNYSSSGHWDFKYISQ